MSVGIVSATERSLPKLSSKEGRLYSNLIQTTAEINPGNSGGPLFNMAGEVIGVNSQIYSTTGGYMGVSFAIPIDVAMQVKDQLVAHGKVTRGRIGVTAQEMTPSLAKSFGLDKARGALISSVEPNGPAAKGGLQAGDVIVGFDGKPIAESGELPSIVARTKPGETVNVRVLRDGAERDLRLSVGEMPSERVSVAGGPAMAQGKLGVTVRPGDEGLEIERAEGNAAQAGLQAGDIIVAINGTPVRSADELKSAVDKAGASVAVLVQRGEARLYVPVPIG